MEGEILVHISAPTTNQNDSLYRSLADAYLEFEPAVSHGRHEVRHQATQRREDASAVSNSSPAIEQPQPPAHEDVSILSTSKSSYGSFPSFIPSENHAVEASPASHDSPGTQTGPTSGRLARLDKIHQHWREQKPPKQGSGRGIFSIKQAFQPSQNQTTFIENTQLAAQALQSQLPDDYSSTDEDTEVSDSFVDGVPKPKQTAQVDNGNVEDNKTDRITSSICEETIIKDSIVEETINTDISKLLSSEPDFDTTIDEITPPPNVDFTTLPVAVFPPEPLISTTSPTSLPSQITPYLASLRAQDSTPFKAIKKQDGPKPDDRGYWNVRCSHWSSEQQLEFWLSLSDDVSAGRLGWGVTLHRVVKGQTGLGDVRVYCWAEIVEHVWLVLRLCSKGRVSNEAMEWFGAGGEVVFEVS